ncbi:MAG TPA: amino acid permease, partial [Chthoniobacteraceae bacterium]
GAPFPATRAAFSIVVIGGLNYYGPKHTGGLAFIISIPAAIVVVLLGAFCVPHLGEALHHVEPLSGGFLKNWGGFVSVVLALSGVEAIANATGVMVLDPGSTDAKPSVSKTSTKAIVWVMIEVCGFTALLGLAMHALSGLQIVPNPAGDDVNGPTPGSEGVRDYMLRYMAQIFVGGSFGPAAGHVAAWAVSIVFGFLLLSAVNTAIVDLIAISFLMARDGEVPRNFAKLNHFGVPTLGIVVATIVPAVLVWRVGDMSGLADLYAVGVVGAIATNLGASSTDRHLALKKWERILMFATFLVMLAIEISLFIYKPNALHFALGILVVGLIGRSLAGERRQKKEAALALAKPGVAAAPRPIFVQGDHLAEGEAMLCAVRGVGRTLDFAIDEARSTDRPLYILFVREQPITTAEDRKRKWQDDSEAFTIFEHASERADGHTVLPCYAVSDSAPETIVDVAATVGASYLVLGAPRRAGLVNLLRGNLVRKVSEILPDDIHLLVYA